MAASGMGGQYWGAFEDQRRPEKLSGLVRFRADSMAYYARGGVGLTPLFFGYLLLTKPRNGIHCLTSAYFLTFGYDHHDHTTFHHAP